jgi:hypothetical protein
MARKIRIQLLRTTRANLEAQKTANDLFEAEPYWITDEQRIAVGTGVNTYTTMPNEADLGDIETLLAAL